jgi:hypothetical protein
MAEVDADGDGRSQRVMTMKAATLVPAIKAEGKLFMTLEAAAVTAAAPSSAGTGGHAASAWTP